MYASEEFEAFITTSLAKKSFPFSEEFPSVSTSKILVEPSIFIVALSNKLKTASFESIVPLIVEDSSALIKTLSHKISNFKSLIFLLLILTNFEFSFKLTSELSKAFIVKESISNKFLDLILDLL